MDPTTIAEGLVKNPLAWISALLITVVAYLFKELRAADKATLVRADAADAAHRETLMKVLPIAEKLTSAVEIMERLAVRDGH